MIALSDAALLYNIDEKNILHWAEQNNVALTRSGDTWLMDDDAVSKLLLENPCMSSKLTEEDIHAGEKEFAEILMQMNKQPYWSKSLKKTDSFLYYMICEMGMLIPDEEKRDVFMEIMSGKDISEVAKKYKISFDRASQLYESAIRIINRNQGFLKNYRAKLANVEWEVRKLQIQNRNQKEHINTLHAVFEKTRFMYKLDKHIALEETEEDIPWVTVRLLSLNLLTDLNLETRITNCLKALGIITVEDLLRYIKRRGGMRCLSTSRNFGEKSCKTLILELEKIGVMSPDGNSQLFKYIE